MSELKKKKKRVAIVILIIQVLLVIFLGFLLVQSRNASSFGNLLGLVVTMILLGFLMFFCWHELNYRDKIGGVLVFFIAVIIFYGVVLFENFSTRISSVTFLIKDDSQVKIESTWELVRPFSELEVFNGVASFDLTQENLKIKKIKSKPLAILKVKLGEKVYDFCKKENYTWWKKESEGYKKQKMLKFIKEKCLKKGDEYLCEDKYFKNGFLILD